MESKQHRERIGSHILATLPTSNVYSLICATTHCLFSLDLIALIVEDSEHETPSSADIKQIVKAVGFSTCVIL